MKVSQLISELQYCLQEHGDVDVYLDLVESPGTYDNQRVCWEGALYVEFHRGDEDVSDIVEIRNWPY